MADMDQRRQNAQRTARIKRVAAQCVLALDSIPVEDAVLALEIASEDQADRRDDAEARLRMGLSG